MASSIRSFKDLTVWQKAMDLAQLVYQASVTLPKEEVYGITSQIKRSAVSIPSNIAEGHARQHTKEFMNFLSITLGSSAELETQIILCVKLGLLTKAAANPLLALVNEVQKMTYSLLNKLKKNKQ